jgi:archaellum component FlaC
MTDETANLILENLRRIRASQERTELDIGEMKVRLSAVEVQTGTINQRLDRLEDRVSRIERRLELVDQ